LCSTVARIKAFYSLTANKKNKLIESLMVAETTGRNIAGSEANDNDEEVEEAVYHGKKGKWQRNK
jgi:hypothetical protein